MQFTLSFVVTCVLVLASVWESQQKGSNIVVLTNKVPEYPIFIPNSVGLFKFRFRGSADCYVLLTNGQQIIYKILIGSWVNTQSAIRKMSEGASKNLVEVKTPNILDNVSLKGFWVSWINGTISAGHDGQIKPFMTWHDTKITHTTHVSVSSAYNSDTCSWIIDTGNLHNEVNKTEMITDNKWRVFMPFSSNIIKFSVRAKRGAYIALANGNCVRYEIMLGGSSNKKSFMQKSDFGYWNVQLASPGLLSEDEYTSFWINWNNGSIKVGRSGDPDPIMSWIDNDPEEITHAAVSTGDVITGHWKMDQTVMGRENVPPIVRISRTIPA